MLEITHHNKSEEYYRKELTDTWSILGTLETVQTKPVKIDVRYVESIRSKPVTLRDQRLTQTTKKSRCGWFGFTDTVYQAAQTTKTYCVYRVCMSSGETFFVNQEDKDLLLKAKINEL